MSNDGGPDPLRQNSASVEVIAKSLSALVAIEKACAKLGWNSERMYAAALIVQLSDSVTSDSYHGTKAFVLATKAWESVNG